MATDPDDDYNEAFIENVDDYLDFSDLQPSEIPMRLGHALDVAAERFRAAEGQQAILVTLCQFLGIVQRAIAELPVSAGSMMPLDKLGLALVTRATGSPHPLLAPAPIEHRPRRSPAKLLAQAAAVLASEIFYRCEPNRRRADASAATLLTELGLRGNRLKGELKGISRRTIRNWRLNADGIGKDEAIESLVDIYLVKIPSNLTPEMAAQLAKRYAKELLDSRLLQGASG